MQHRQNALRATLAALTVAVAVAACSADQPQDHLAKAKVLLAKKDDAAAIIELKSAIQRSPDLSEPRHLLGTTLMRQGDPSAAEVELRKALGADQAQDQVLADLARAMLLQGKESKVIEELGRTQLDNKQAQADLSTSLALAYAAMGKPDLSSSALSEALVADPSHAPARLMNARKVAASGDHGRSLSLIEEVIVADRANASAWVLKGNVLQYGLRQSDDALMAYRSAIDANPKFIPAHLAAIKLLADAGKGEEARKQFEQLKGVAPQHPRTVLTDARLAFQRRDFKSARAIGQQLIRLAPDNPEVLLLMGGVELESGSLRQAETYLTKVLLAHPGAIHAWRLMQATYLKSGQPTKALAALETVLGKGELAPELLGLAGEIYLYNGNAAKAEEFFNKALKHDPKNSDARIALALTRLSGTRSAEALEELQQIAESGPGIKADLAVISTHLRRGEHAKALAAIDRLEGKVPKDARTHELRGRVQLALRDRPSARKSFERALEVQPDFFAAAARLSSMDLEDKDLKSAKARFESLLSRDPKHELALLGLAELAVMSGASKDETVALFNRAIEARPSAPSPRVQLVDYLLKLRDAKQALVVARGADAATPDNVLVLESLGRAQQAAGEINQAVSTFGRITSLVPNSPAPHVRLAGIYLLAKDPKAAERSLRKALEIRANDLQTQKALVAFLLTQKRADEAISVARVVQQQTATQATGHMIEGDVRSTQRDWAGAAAAYRTALKVQPTTEASGKLHAVLMNAGKAADADSHAAAWIKSYPQDAKFMSDVVDSALARKDLVVAERTLRTLLKVQPNSAIALNNMAWVAGQLKQSGALEYAEKANQLMPNQPFIMDTLAMQLSAAGQHARAIEVQRNALKLQPSHTAMRMNLARILIAAGDAAAARPELDSLVKLGAGHPVYAEATTLLKTLP